MTKIVLVFALFLLVSCGLLTPAQQATALGAIDTLRASGALTEEQYAAMREAILGSGMLSWLNKAATAVTGAALGYFSVQMRRGPVATSVEREVRKARARAEPVV